jgi:U6 snRNA-associated Sm-like protein LSm6
MDASPRPPSDGSPPPPLPAPPQKYTGSPTDFLKGVVGKRVIVRLTSGVDYQGQIQFSLQLTLTDFLTFFKGILSCLDGFMNIALEQTEEYVNGAVTNRYGDAFVRGNNGAFFSLCLHHVECMLNSFLVLYISAAETI